MMKEPTRLIHEDPGFAHLVAASEDDGPSRAQIDEAVSLARRVASASRWRMWRLLGTGTAIASVAVLGFFAASSSNTSPESPVAKSAEVAAPFVAPPDPVAPTEALTAVPTAALTAMPTVAPTSEPSAIAEAVVPSPALPAAAASVVRTVAPRRRPENANANAERSTFDEELALLSAARSGLATKDIPGCLRAVERYETRFRSGLFAQEMEVIRIEALATSGERARAHALADAFLAANPSSPYAARVRSLAERTRD